MKTQRHRAILEIVESHAVETQEDLAAMLGEYGFTVTQATVSRDIKELRLLKVLTDRGTYRYAVAEKAEQGLAEFHQLAVLHAHLGHHAVARGGKFIHYLHGFYNTQGLAFFNSLANANKRFCLWLWRKVCNANQRAV